MTALALGGCGDSAGSTDSSSDSEAVDGPCGSAQAEEFAANLVAAGYSSVKVRSPRGGDVTSVESKVPELGAGSAAAILVYCDEAGAEEQNLLEDSQDHGEGLGFVFVNKVVGPVNYAILGVPELDVYGDQQQPVPALDPILGRLIADASG